MAKAPLAQSTAGHRMFAKRTLGIAYLVGTGSLLAVALATRHLVVGPGTFATAFGTATGLLLALVLVYAGYWLDRSRLAGDRIWQVALWAGVGIGLMTLLGVGSLVLASSHRSLPAVVPNLLVSNIAAGGVVGTLVGVITQLRREHETTRTLHERNTVLHRVLRHNIRNEMNVILGYAEGIETDAAGRPADDAGRIRESAETVTALSRTAKRIETALAAETSLEPVEVAAVVRECARRLRARYPTAEIEVSDPDEAWGVAAESLDVVVETVLENAIQYAGDDPVVIEVERPTRSADPVRIHVSDRGPGFPEMERAVFSDGGGETPLDHSSGLGLWFVRWAVDTYGGSVTLAENDPSGSVITIDLPSATPPHAGDRASLGTTWAALVDRLGG